MFRLMRTSRAGTPLLAQSSDLVVDKNGSLLVVNAGTPPSVTAYANALTLGSINGNVAASRNLQGGATGLSAAGGNGYK